MKNTTSHLAALLLASAQLFSQTATPANSAEKGGRPLLKSAANRPPSAVRAVVIGISDYRDKDITDLQFADKDAEAFAAYLARSMGPAALDGNHLKVLINQQATGGEVISALLCWLPEVTRKGDQVIIYFSGHGDVEKKLRGQPGYLLCHDANSRGYAIGGALDICLLQNIITTLSVDSMARVMVVADACHAGKLAGGPLGGQSTTLDLKMLQYENETKLLSCEPNQFSQEGRQWGGGRGAFSYHLVDALLGMADANKDRTVTLREVRRYLQDNVPAEVAPNLQDPVVNGNLDEQVAEVDSALVAELSAGRTSQLLVFSPTAQRAAEADGLLDGVDSVLRKTYFLFEKALRERAFFSPPEGSAASRNLGGQAENACADAYFERLIREPSLERLHSAMRRNYAAALQDDAQTVLARWLRTDLDETALSKKTRAGKYAAYPKYLQKAADLLGEDNFAHPVLMARKHFFEGYLLALSNQNPDAELGARAIAEFRECLRLQPRMAMADWQMAWVFAQNLQQPDSAEQCARRAMEVYPTWVLPRTDLAYLLSVKFKDFDRARPYLEEAERIDPNSADVWNAWGIFFKKQKKYADAELSYKKAIKLDSAYPGFYNNLGAVLDAQNSLAEAELFYKKTIELDPTRAEAHNNLAALYFDTRRPQEAEIHFRKAIELDSTDARAPNGLGLLFREKGNDREAEAFFRKAVRLDPRNAHALNSLAVIFATSGRAAEAEAFFKKAIAADPDFGSAANNLGAFFYENGRLAEAKPLLEKAVTLEAGLSNAHYLLACIECDEGHLDRAIEHLERALKTGSDFGEAQQDPVLAPLRALPEWKELMKKYFPDKVKD